MSQPGFSHRLRYVKIESGKTKTEPALCKLWAQGPITISKAFLLLKPSSNLVRKKQFQSLFLISAELFKPLGEEEEEEMAICMCCESRIVPKSIMNPWISPRRTKLGFVAISPTSTTIRRSPATVRASAVDSPESSSNFAKRVEQAWLISQVPPLTPC